MIRRLFLVLGKLSLWMASAAFLTGVSLFVLGSLILTWPILRMSPRDQKVRAVADLARAVMTAVQVFGQKRVAQMIAQSQVDASDDPPE